MSNHNTLMLAGALALSLASHTQAALFLTDTTIGAANTNYDGQDVVVIGCTLTIDGAHSFSDLLVIENGVVTCSPLDTNNTGGLSGPAIKPIAVRMVYEAAQAVKIPICGLGGITTAEDAVEFLLAGATAVQIGTASYADPRAVQRIAESLERWCVRHRVAKVKDLIGAVQPN